MPPTSRRPWDLPDRLVTPEETWLSRRALVGGLAAAGLVGCSVRAADPLADDPLAEGPSATESPYTLPAATPDPRWTAERPDTPRELFTTHNNYYEFTTRKEDVWRRARGFSVQPWTVEVAGEVHEPGTFDIESLLATFPLQERRYRFRCVEAWSMVVPWVGFPLAALLERVRPTSDARFVKLVAFHRPTQALGQLTQPWYPWPYQEGLRLDEAMHELTLLAVGAYGRALPTQNGAPLRLVVPWKYGFKNIKGIVRIELVRDRPETLWNTVAPLEYGFLANVDPRIPHPRWSQATERDLATGDRIETRPYNGYGEQVARLYTG